MCGTRSAQRALVVVLLPLGLMLTACRPKRPTGSTLPGRGEQTDADLETRPRGTETPSAPERSRHAAADATQPSKTEKPTPAAHTGPPGQRTPVDPRLLWAAKVFEQVHNPPEMKDQEAVIRLLSAYAAVQAAFRRAERYPGRGLVYANPQHGKGFPDLYQIGGPGSGGAVLKLVNKAFAEATSPEHALSGYYFVDITSDARTGAYDYTKQFGLCAVPGRYNRGRGPPKPATLVINVAGKVWMADTRGEPVTVFPDVTKMNWLEVHVP